MELSKQLPKKQVAERPASEKAEHLAKEQSLRKAVFDAICTLTDAVDEAVLLNTLNCLDQNSWMEVVEERYLGRICGFPLCSNPVEVKTTQKYRIDLKNKKVFERSAEIDRYCCQNCFLRSAALRAQLEVEPLWIRGDELKKVFDLSSKVSKQQENAGDIEFVEKQHLITSLENLKIGNTVESDDDDGGSEQEDEGKEGEAHEEIYNRCWSFLTHKPTTAGIKETRDRPVINKSMDNIVSKMETDTNKEQSKQLSDSEKLARIRNKYSQKELKRHPVMIEAKPLAPNHDDKTVDCFYDDFRRTLSEWCGPETIRYLHCRGRTDLSDGEDEVVTEAERIIAQFYGGGQPIKEEVVAKDIFLPAVDNTDQAKQRVSVLAEMLKPSWRLLEEKLGVSGCGRRALEIISTFRLSAANIVLERREYDLAVAVIFRLNDRVFPMVAADLCAGYTLLALSAIIFPYLLTWIYVIPFTSQDFFIRSAFSSQFLALLFPLICFVFALLCVGLFALTLFVGHIRKRTYAAKLNEKRVVKW